MPWCPRTDPFAADKAAFEGQPSHTGMQIQMLAAEHLQEGRGSLGRERGRQGGDGTWMKLASITYRKNAEVN